MAGATAITENARSQRLPTKLRWLALFAACVSGFALSLAGGILVLPLPFMRLLGAAIDGWAPFAGRLLVLMGATLSSVWVLLFVAPASFGGMLALSQDHDLNVMLLGLVLIGFASVALVVWLDVELVMYERKCRTK